MGVLEKARIGLLQDTLKLMRVKDQTKVNLNEYEKLFSNMGIIDVAEGERIECVVREERPCYKLIKFKMSDNLSYLKFKKHIEYIREKIAAPKLEIYTEDTLMCFRVFKAEFPIMYYKYHKIDRNRLPLGHNLDNELVTLNLCSDPNVLIGGVPTCGKTTLLHTMICHIIENNQGLLWLIDLKAGLEFGRYKGVKQLRGYSQDLEPSKAVVKSFVKEMERRFKLLEAAGVQKYEDYIKTKYIPRAFLVIDEFTDLMQLLPKGKGKELQYNIIDDLITLGRKARCVGMHLILSSQGLNATSLDPNIKRVCSAVVGFRAVNSINSQVVIDEPGLEELPNFQAYVRKEGNKTLIRTMLIDVPYISSVIKNNIEVKTETGIEAKPCSINDIFK